MSLRNKPEKNEWHVNRTHIFKCYHYISLLRFRILKLAKHFLHHLHDRATWLSGKLWVVKWMFHDTTQMAGISCLIHNIPLSVQVKKTRKTDKPFTSNTIPTESKPVAYIWGNSDGWESSVKLLDFYVAEARPRLFFFNGEKNTVPWNKQCSPDCVLPLQ